MTQFANGGLITGPGNDPTPIFTETMLVRLDNSYMLPASAVRELGGAACLGLLAKLNAANRHHAGGSARPTVASIRKRLLMEACLPPGVQPTPENMLRHYGIST